MSGIGYLILAALFALLAGVILWPLDRLRQADDVMLQPHGDLPRLDDELLG